MDRALEFAANHPILISTAVFLTILTLANEIRMVSRRGVDLGPNEAVRLINGGALTRRADVLFDGGGDYV